MQQPIGLLMTPLLMVSEENSTDYISKWLKFNKLKLNVNKTKYKVFSRRCVDFGAHEALSTDKKYPTTEM
jgi:hypothetical protein